MYSPQIRDDLIPLIYRAAKSDGIPMTTWVNRAVERTLPQSKELETGQPQKEENDSNGGEAPRALADF